MPVSAPSEQEASRAQTHPNFRMREFGDCANIKVPAAARKVSDSAFAGRFRIPERESSASIKKGKRHDATCWRTHSPRAVNADSRTVFHRPARLSRHGHAAGGSHGPLVQRVHGRNANPPAANFSDGKPHHHAAFGFRFWRD